jgi:hypothetical protein
MNILLDKRKGLKNKGLFELYDNGELPKEGCICEPGRSAFEMPSVEILYLAVHPPARAWKTTSDRDSRKQSVEYRSNRKKPGKIEADFADSMNELVILFDQRDDSFQLGFSVLIFFLRNSIDRMKSQEDQQL